LAALVKGIKTGAAVTPKVRGDGFASAPPLLFVVDIVNVPGDAGVYVNVALEEPGLSVIVDGVNIPPAPPSFGVTTTLEDVAPFNPTLKLLDATPTVPVLGPDKVVAVATTSV